MPPKLAVIDRAPLPFSSSKKVIALLQVHDWAQDTRPRSLGSSRIKRVLYKKKTTSWNTAAAAKHNVECLIALINSRPLSWQAAEAEGDASVKSYVESLLRELREEA